MTYPRIIPARAGFTPSGPTPVSSGPDHPRSRGVYRNPLVEPVLRGGSSPLARGLPPQPNPTQSRGRVIPARAGFTPFFPARAGFRPGHPRSRGVYVLIFEPGVQDRGSSPLARGLRTRLSPRPMTVGIIPARAGFTGPMRSPRCAVRDHPRSRGVYGAGYPFDRMVSGSSPLARGLPLGRPG